MLFPRPAPNPPSCARCRQGEVMRDVDEEEDYLTLKADLERDTALRLLCPRVSALLAPI